MRWAILAASVAASALSAGTVAWAQEGKAEPAVQRGAGDAEITPTAALRATSPADAAPGRSYESTSAALLEADVDYLIREGRRAVERNDEDGLWYIAVFADDLAAGRLEDARRALQRSPQGANGPVGDMLEPFLVAAEGNIDRAVERVDSGTDNLPAPLPEVARALLFEAGGRLEEAAAVYALMVERLDTTPPGEAEPQTREEYERVLNAARVSHAVYRAALVHHRLGRTEAARRYYNVVLGYAPRAIDTHANLARLDAGQPPFEEPLTVVAAAGRWMLFVSELQTQTEALVRMLSQQDPPQGLTSEMGTALLQIGMLLARDSDDWRLYAAQQAIDAGGLDGAQRIIEQIGAGSPIAPFPPSTAP